MTREDMVEAMATASAKASGFTLAAFDTPTHAKYIRQAQAALTALEAMGLVVQGWQDIKSAPPLTEIDIWITGLEEDGWRISGQIPSTQEPLWIKTEAGNYWPHENGGYPTHWMPLPAAPLTARGG